MSLDDSPDGGKRSRKATKVFEAAPSHSPRSKAQGGTSAGGGSAGKAKAGKLAPAEFQSGTFAISNLGMFGVSQFGSLLPPGTGSILAIGGAQEAVKMKDGKPVAVKEMEVTITCDHRHIYGADAALRSLRHRLRAATSPAECGHGQFCSRNHCKTCKCPPLAASHTACSSHVSPSLRNHLSASKCPPSAAY